MKIESAIDTWPKGSRHIGIRTYDVSDLGRYGMCREFEVNLWCYQVLVEYHCGHWCPQA